MGKEKQPELLAELMKSRKTAQETHTASLEPRGGKGGSGLLEGPWVVP